MEIDHGKSFETVSGVPASHSGYVLPHKYAHASKAHKALQVLGETFNASGATLIIIGSGLITDTFGVSGLVESAGVLYIIAGSLLITGASLKLLDSLRDYYHAKNKGAPEKLEIFANLNYLAGSILFVIAAALFTSADSGVITSANILWIISTSIYLLGALSELVSDMYSFQWRTLPGVVDGEEGRGRLAATIGSASFSTGALLLLLGSILYLPMDQTVQTAASTLWIVSGGFLIAGSAFKATAALREY